MTNDPFNPNQNPPQVDPYTAALRKMRIKWLLWSLIPSVLAVAIIVFITYVLTYSAQGTKAYDAEDYPEAISQFVTNSHWKPAQQWIAPYHNGTALLADGSYLDAIIRLENAKEKAPKADPEADYTQLDQDSMPPVCLINNNISVAHTMIGNDKADEAQPYLEEFRSTIAQLASAKDTAAYQTLKDSLTLIAVDGIPLFEEALAAHQEAQTVRDEYKCPDPTQISEELAEAQQTSQDAIDEMQNPELPPPPEKEEPEEEPEPEQEPETGDSESGDDESEEQDPGDTEQGPGDQAPAELEEGEGGASELSPGESDRREKLDESNKAGQKERDATESYMGGYEYTPKQW